MEHHGPRAEVERHVVVDGAARADSEVAHSPAFLNVLPMDGPVAEAVLGRVVRGVQRGAAQAHEEVVDVDQPIDEGRLGALAGHGAVTAECNL